MSDTHSSDDADFSHPARAARMAELINDLPREELIQTTLRAIDNAYAASAELGARRATFEAEHGPISDLAERNRMLTAANAELRARLDVVERSWLYRLARRLGRTAEAPRGVRSR